MVCVLKSVLFCTYSFNDTRGSPAVGLGTSRWSQINSFLVLQHSMMQLCLSHSKESYGGDIWKNLCTFYFVQNAIWIEREWGRVKWLFRHKNKWLDCSVIVCLWTEAPFHIQLVAIAILWLATRLDDSLSWFRAIFFVCFPMGDFFPNRASWLYSVSFITIHWKVHLWPQLWDFVFFLSPPLRMLSSLGFFGIRLNRK